MTERHLFKTMVTYTANYVVYVEVAGGPDSRNRAEIEIDACLHAGYDPMELCASFTDTEQRCSIEYVERHYGRVDPDYIGVTDEDPAHYGATRMGLWQAHASYYDVYDNTTEGRVVSLHKTKQGAEDAARAEADRLADCYGGAEVCNPRWWVTPVELLD